MTDTHDQDSDGRATCPHQDAVKWNPFNKVVQCHRCGEVFVPEGEATTTPTLTLHAPCEICGISHDPHMICQKLSDGSVMLNFTFR